MKKIILILCILTSFLSCALSDRTQFEMSPGEYPQNIKFYSISFSNATILLYIDKIEILEDYTFKFYVTWEASISEGLYDYITKESDINNIDMNATDNLGNRYDHIDNEGVGFFILYDGDSQTGWFLFPTVNQDITSLTFNDDDQNKSITFYCK